MLQPLPYQPNQKSTILSQLTLHISPVEKYLKNLKKKYDMTI